MPTWTAGHIGPLDMDVLAARQGSGRFGPTLPRARLAGTRSKLGLCVHRQIHLELRMARFGNYAGLALRRCILLWKAGIRTAPSFDMQG